MTRAEQTRAAQARYARTAKGKATYTRYNRSAAGRATVARYRATARGRQVQATRNARRIFVGGDYLGRAKTIELAAAIRIHVEERTREFITRQQARAEAEGAAAGAVSTEAGA